MTKKLCGYTGKGLRINLTTREVKVEATFPRFKDDIGGTAIGYKVFWEEVDPKTSCYDPENKLVIAPGPLSGTGAICSGRTAITTLWPTAYPQSLIASAHVGGELAHKLKFAGWDFVIIEGESAKPIYLYINNDKVEFRDASAIWGQGTYRSASMLAQETRPDVSIGTIGPAGENGVPMSNMMVDRSHSAGGVGSIMGKKKLKALVVWGDGAVHIAASPKQWEELVDQHRSILGAHTQSFSFARVLHACKPLVGLSGCRLGCSQSARDDYRKGDGSARPQPHWLPHLLFRVLPWQGNVAVHRAQHRLLCLPDSLLLGYP